MARLAVPLEPASDAATFRAQDSISDGDMIAQAFKALSLGVIVGTTTYGGLAETACEYEFVDGGSCCIAGIPRC